MGAPSQASNAAIPFNRVVIAVDASLASLHAVNYTQHLLPAEAHIRLVSVAQNPRVLLPITPLVGDELSAARAELLRDAGDALNQAKDVLSQQGRTAETELVDLSKQGGDVVHALTKAAGAWHADLLVVGARQHHGLLRWVEGTVSEPLAHMAGCAILVVPAQYDASPLAAPRRILCAIDGSKGATQALRQAARLTSGQTDLRTVYVVDRAVRLTDFVPIHMLEEAFVDDGKQALENARQLLAGTPGGIDTAMISTETTNDDIAHAIVRDAQQWQADLMVLGMHGRRGIARWLLGSVASRVAHLTPVPLLLVPVKD